MILLTERTGEGRGGEHYDCKHLRIAEILEKGPSEFEPVLLGIEGQEQHLTGFHLNSQGKELVKREAQ